MGNLVIFSIDVDLEYPCPPGTKTCGPGITPGPNDASDFVKLI